MNELKHKLSNPLALAVLVLLFERPMHPYEMATTLRERGKENSIRLNYGSLYTVIEQLQREEFIVIRETLKEGRRPQKTIYELSTEGERELNTWMRELISAPIKEYPQFEAALSLIPALSPEEASDLLEIRVGLIKRTLEKIENEMEHCREIKLPRLFSIESEYFKAITEAELKFSERLLNDIRKDSGGLKSTWVKLRKTLLTEKNKREKTSAKRKS